MDTSNFQVLGESPNPSTDFNAGEFAKSSLVSPVVTLGAASIGSLVRITKDCRPDLVGQFGIITNFSFYPIEICPYQVNFDFGFDYYQNIDFDLVLPSSSPSKDLQFHLVSHLNALLTVPHDSVNIPALLFVVDKLYQVIAFDDEGFNRDLESNNFHACQLLRFGFEDLTIAFKFGRRVSGVFVDRAFEHLKHAAAILKADALGVA